MIHHIGQGEPGTRTRLALIQHGQNEFGNEALRRLQRDGGAVGPIAQIEFIGTNIALKRKIRCGFGFWHGDTPQVYLIPY